MIDFDSLLNQMRANSSKTFDDFNKKIINSSIETIGCSVPFIRKLAKTYARQIDEVIELPTNAFVEVDMLKGIVISQSKLPFEQKRNYLSNFVNTIENWAVCDVSTVKVPVKEREEYFKLFLSFVENNHIFVCRYGIVNLLANYLDSEHIDQIFAYFNVISFGQYYIDMAVAWLVATAMVKCREQTIRYIECDGRRVLNSFSYNKALQKMRDSYRISDQDKQWTYSLKR